MGSSLRGEAVDVRIVRWQVKGGTGCETGGDYDDIRVTTSGGTDGGYNNIWVAVLRLNGGYEEFA